jgi:hypothetical protein
LVHIASPFDYVFRNKELTTFGEFVVSENVKNYK